jgi:hypothetical protein
MIFRVLVALLLFSQDSEVRYLHVTDYDHPSFWQGGRLLLHVLQVE